MKYLEYTFSGFKDENAAEILIALLNNAGYTGFLESGHQLKAYIGAADRDEKLLGILLEELKDHTGELEFTSTGIPETNWNAKWESEFEPVKVGSDVYIRAPFHPHEQGFVHELIIEPKMSFGTGHHETTRLMVKSMLKIDLTAKNVLDMGCGTGVLAILASKMKSATVLGIDIDEWACRNSIENAAVNLCDNIYIEKGDVSAVSNRRFEVILANINRNVLLRDMKLYHKVLQPGGILVISGILLQDKKMIMDEAARYKLTCQESREENNWLSIIFQKDVIY